MIINAQGKVRAMVDKAKVLKEYFGYDKFRTGQEEVVDALLAGQDVLAVMPTGAGKSVCFQVPALLLPGITLVVSPLISLMQDQVRELVEAGVPAAYLNSALTDAQYAHALRNAVAGKYKIIYAAPERLLTDRFQAFVRQVQVSLVAVDEAHCVSQWGQDFRPGYLQVTDFVAGLAQRPVVAAFTATATQAVKQDIVRLLQLRDARQVVTGFDRENLFYEVRRPRDKKAELLTLLRRFPEDAGIVYCSTRKAVEDVCAFLNEQGHPAARYHAGLSQQERQKNQEDFLYDRVSVMVATNAFGMGIDKSNVRFVIHFNMPKDLESYYQEAGRAGRDGAPAQCILLYSGQDVRTNQFLIEHGGQDDALDEETREEVRKKDRERLRQMTFYSTTQHCLRHFILKYFGESSPMFCNACGNCTAAAEEVDVTVDAQKILCCVRRTGERFGVALITDILVGAQNERIERLELNRQSTYGALAGLRVDAVRTRIQWLLESGCLQRSDSEYPVLLLGPQAEEVLFHGQKVTLRTVREEKKPSQKRQQAGAEIVNPELFERLRALRKKIAAKQSVPAFVIFTDATLRAMSAYMPVSEQEMIGKVNGVGEKKLRRYGEAFLACIRAYKQEGAAQKEKS
ncbi:MULTISPECIES: DNA helicase RecQ [Caproicibacterium]|uniref:DNA helicase RecQ n=1 Tax=Caproicibacterium argilliputei TaxID=3030016 RepID=A0AA97D9V8_9FIRM|nr:DNA helicase RecQ [Caproicibacterium argilliputei]WOC32439.1 DNA helicase RecQ [Caproicibacterium argilliputei]